jgi:outer membrane lipoprotein carrier protein
MNKLNWIANIFIFAGAMLLLSLTNINDNFIAIKDPSQIKAKIIAKAKQTHALKSDFVQEKHLGMFKEIMISKGKFYFQEPHFIRWQYNEPIEYTIVLNGKQVQIMDAGKIKSYNMNSNPIFNEINQLMLGALNGTMLDSKKFKVSYFQNKEYYMARLIPQQAAMTEVLSSIELYFNAIDYGVVSIKLTENSDDFTILNFKQRIVNGEIPKNTFQLNP